MSWAQDNSTGTVAKATGTPVIDGVIDAGWSTTEQINIERIFIGEVPTVGPVGTTYYKALWDLDGMYVILVVNDDAWIPNWAAGTDHFIFLREEKIDLVVFKLFCPQAGLALTFPFPACGWQVSE